MGERIVPHLLDMMEVGKRMPGRTRRNWLVGLPAFAALVLLGMLTETKPLLACCIIYLLLSPWPFLIGFHWRNERAVTEYSRRRLVERHGWISVIAETILMGPVFGLMIYLSSNREVGYPLRAAQGVAVCAGIMIFLVYLPFFAGRLVSSRLDKRGPVARTD